MSEVIVGFGEAFWNRMREDILTSNSSINLEPGNLLGLTISVTSCSNSLSRSGPKPGAASKC